MDTPEREAQFEEYKGEGWQQEYAEYRSAWSELPKRQEVRDYPLLVDVELASICNLRCPMCYTITDKFKENAKTTCMDWDLYRKIIDEIGGRCCVAIEFAWRSIATIALPIVSLRQG